MPPHLSKSLLFICTPFSSKRDQPLPPQIPTPTHTRCLHSSEHNLKRTQGFICALAFHVSALPRWVLELNQPLVYTGRSEASRSPGLVWDPQTVGLLVISVSSGVEWAYSDRAGRVQATDRQQSPHGRWRWSLVRRG